MSKKLLNFLIILIGFSSCAPIEESDTFWNNIKTSSEYNPFVFIFSNSQIPTCANYAQPKLEEVLNGEIEGISKDKVNGCMMYSSVSDYKLYSNIAEELKFLFDLNGDNTFKSYPAYVNNLICYNVDSTSWHTSIKSDITKSPVIKLGIKTTPSGNQIKVYVKGEYTSSLSEHTVAVYVYRKSEQASQETSNGTELFTVKNKIYTALTPTSGRSLSANSSGQQFREIFTLDTNNENTLNLGIIAVVYRLIDNKPTEILNSIRLDEL
mgnify:CR=1 FL=1